MCRYIHEQTVSEIEQQIRYHRNHVFDKSEKVSDYHDAMISALKLHPVLLAANLKRREEWQAKRNEVMLFRYS